MRILILRHGETEWNTCARLQGQQDIDLNENGIRLAHVTAANTRDLPVDICFTSPLKRAKNTAELVLEGRIAHGGNAPLRWMMDNIYVRTDPAGNIKPDKEKSTERIDGAVATIMALNRAIRNENAGTSVYDERGILFL